MRPRVYYQLLPTSIEVSGLQWERDLSFLTELGLEDNEVTS